MKYRGKRQLLVILTGFLLLNHGLMVSSEKPRPTPERSDVRVIIDISGSMKQNDPNNLRIPALQIITNLLPKGSDSGVWTFGKYVNMLVPLGRVDGQWQDNANAAANQINSAGLFTNIGDAMAKSTWDWNRPDETESRSMILLTDGMVDVSKEPGKNEAERQRIFNEIVPRLKNAGVTIHTIALSQDADAALLSTIAKQTDGWFQAVSDAEELQRVFLKIFEQATPRDSLPLTNNQFKVDASIEEMTLLVFRQEGSQSAQLLRPDQSVITKNSKDKKLRWFSSKAYDLITITEPSEGDWQIDAAIDPDNRVMVVSQLGLTVEPLPNNVLANEQIQYAVTLKEQGEPITRQDFLNLVDARLQTQYAGQNNVTPLLADRSQGRFQQVFYAGDKDGVLNIKLVVKSPTFERSRTHAINIYGSPVQPDLQMSFEVDKPHKVFMRIAEDVVRTDSLKVSGKMIFPDDTLAYFELDNWLQANEIELKMIPEGGPYRVEIHVEGLSQAGRKFESELTPLEFIMEPLEGYGKVEEPVLDQEEPTETMTEPVIEEPEVEPAKDENIQTVVQSVTSEPVKEPVNWTLWLSVGLGGNIILIIAGWFGWRFIRKRSIANSEYIAAQLFDEEETREGKAS